MSKPLGLVAGDQPIAFTPATANRLWANDTPDSALARDHIFSCATTKAAVVIRASAISRALVGD
jgi:hypothetical protein